MSRLPSRASVSKTSTLAKIPEGSVSGLVVRLQLVKAPKMGASGKNTPGNLSIMVHERVEIPYVFLLPKSPGAGKIPKNTITKPLSGAITKPRILLPGQTYLISMFNIPSNLTCGNLYRLDGVYLDAYMGPRMRKDENGIQFEEQMTEPELSMKCARISTNVDEMTDDEFDNSIEFVYRSIDHARDIPGDDRLDAYTIDATKGPYYTFITLVGITDGNPGTLEGFIQAPFNGCTPLMEYEPFNTAKGARDPAVLELTGGWNGQDAEDAQLHIQQNNPDGSVKLYKFFTRVKANQGLTKFQLDWKKMGHILGPNMIGKATCTINRTKTKELEEDAAFDGVLAGNATIRPDMGAMVKVLGHKFPWSLCELFDPRLKELEVMLSDVPQIRYQDATALNLLRYTGNASLLPRAEEKGWVEFYVTTNMPIEDDERRQEIEAMTPEQKAAEFRNKKFYGGRLDNMCIGVFAVPTAACPLKLHEMVSAKDTPSGALLFEDAKRVKTED